MAALRHTMQKDIFSPADERLLAVVSVTKPGRKKRSSFLCISVNKQESTHQVLISRVKTSDKKEPTKDGGYKRVKTWQMRELKVVDARSADIEVPEFDLHFDKQIFKWIASSVSEKKGFITCLYKMSRKYLDRKKISFVHVDEDRLDELLYSVDPKSRAPGVEDIEEVQQEEYQELTAHEEADLENLLLRDNAIQDATVFMEHLSEELAQLDRGNIHALMGSEQQIRELMSNLDQAVLEVEKMEMRLNVYDQLLSNVRMTMSKLSEQYSRILLENKNLRALCTEVDDLVTKLDIDDHIVDVLETSPLSGAIHIRECSAAAQTLQEAMGQDLSQGVALLQAVADRKKFFDELSFTFARRVHEHLSGLFVENSSQMLEMIQVRHTNAPNISSHSQVHGMLLPYSPLMKWLKECVPSRFAEVMEAYIRSFRRVYEEEIRQFMSDLRGSLGRGGAEIKKTGLAGVKLTGSLMSLSPSRGGGAGGISQSMADVFTSSGGGVSGSDQVGRPKFDQAFSLLLEQLQPVCVSEQKFLTSFFHFAKPDRPQELEEPDGEDETDSGGHVRTPVFVDVTPPSSNSRVGGVLGQLFAVLLQDIEAFIHFGDRLDNYNALYLLVCVSQRLVDSVESGAAMSYLDETLKNALICIRRLFDKFITIRRRQIEDMKVPRGSKCGILPCVTQFNEFAERSEAIVMATDRRAELDKAYKALSETLFNTIERVAREHPKTPPGVIRFENYHKIFDILSRLKIACLESCKEEAKRRFRSRRSEYVKNSLGRPLEKLSLFFEGVEGLIAGGTKVEEVGYRLDYSRNELKKCAKEYPGKEVKRGLEKLYRRAEKDVSEEMLQVVWGCMQEAFMEQCRRFEALIKQCYSSVSLEFTLGDLADYFASISAQR